MTKGIIYYTDNRLGEPIFSVCQKNILTTGIPIVSCSLKPISFGRNTVLDLVPGPVTMAKQILVALNASDTEWIFFCEHDVLYHSTHFEFTPSHKDVFYYNTNVWRWEYRGDKVITYDNFRSLSGLCVSREKAIEHYEKKIKLILERGWDKVPGRNPRWARSIGYEPGKSKRIGGFSDDRIEEWRSVYPNIDIRHGGTLTPIKMTLESFVHRPTGWKESVVDSIEGWNVKSLFL